MAVEPGVRCCPLGHALVQSVRAGVDEPEGEDSLRVAAYLRCDTCGGAVGRGGALYSCAPCDFDLCEACYPHPTPSRNQPEP